MDCFKFCCSCNRRFSNTSHALEGDDFVYYHFTHRYTYSERRQGILGYCTDHFQQYCFKYAMSWTPVTTEYRRIVSTNGQEQNIASGTKLVGHFGWHDWLWSWKAMITCVVECIQKYYIASSCIMYITCWQIIRPMIMQIRSEQKFANAPRLKLKWINSRYSWWFTKTTWTYALHI
jgi:hypothetical protein